MRKRHTTRYPGIYYRLTDETNPDSQRRYIVWWSDINGRGHTLTLPLGTTLEGARAKQGELKHRRQKGEALVQTRMSVGELLDLWLTTRSESVKPKTVEDYEWAIRHLNKHVGRAKVTELTATDVARMISSMKADNMKTWTVRKILSPLSAAYRLAMREGWVSASPVEKLMPHERPKGDQKQMRVLSREEIRLLIENAGSERWEVLFSVLAYTGLRISEALALTWDDITPEAIIVRASKTQAGVREVMLPHSLHVRLARYMLANRTRSQYVFSTKTGGPVPRRLALVALRAAEKRAGLPDFTLHELRHTYASLLIAQGEPPTLIARQMGHSDPGVTMGTYAHLFEGQESIQAARSRLDAAIGM